MNQIPWGIALAVFMGTLPLLGAVVWNLIDVKSIRSEMISFRAEMRAELLSIRGELNTIKTDITHIRERLATLEERDRLGHPVLKG